MLDLDDDKAVDEFLRTAFEDIIRREVVVRLMRTYPLTHDQLLYLSYFQYDLLVYDFDIVTNQPRFGYDDNAIMRALDYHAMKEEEYRRIYDPKVLREKAEESFRKIQDEYESLGAIIRPREECLEEIRANSLHE